MSAPRPRPALDGIPAYVPGRPPPQREDRPTYKLSSNENPYDPLPGIVTAVAEAAGSMNRYPDMGCTGLYDALAARFDVPADWLAAGTGSVAVLYHLLQAFCESGDEVVYAWRSFEAYPIAVSVTGATSVQVPVDAEGRHDLPAMAAAITERTKVVLVCSPNNPTGPVVGRRELESFLAAVPEHVLVVLDEAYREFARVEDPVDGVSLVRDHANVVALRTFAKASGLAGLRVGYLVAEPDVAAAVRTCALPFGVSSVAQAAAVAALDHEAELLERVEAIVVERDRVAAALRDQGFVVPDAQGNFVWLPLAGRVADFVDTARAEGLMVRPFAGEGVRVSIGTAAANDLLLEVTAGFDPDPGAADQD